MEKKNELVEVWGDVVSIKSLVLSIGLSILTTMGAYFLAPSDDRTLGLFFGLGGAVLGFVISTVLIKPKRVISLEDSKE